MTQIDWSNATSPIPSAKLAVGEVEIGTPHEVHFEEVRQLEDGAIVATVNCETLEGNTLWLRSARYGPQNGLLSLIKAAESGENIEGNAFNYERVSSEKSPTGWAHRWTVPQA